MYSSPLHLRPHLWQQCASCLEHLLQINIGRVQAVQRRAQPGVLQPVFTCRLFFLTFKKYGKSILLLTGEQVS